MFFNIVESKFLKLNFDRFALIIKAKSITFWNQFLAYKQNNYNQRKKWKNQNKFNLKMETLI